LQNSYDGTFSNVTIGGPAPCLLSIADTSRAIAPNANDFYTLLVDGQHTAGTVPICISSTHNGIIGPIHFFGGDFGHPGTGKNLIQISRSGTGYSFALAFSGVYMESNSTDTSTAIISASDTARLSFADIHILRLNGRSTAACLSVADSGSGQTDALSLKNFVCTGGTGANALTSTVTGIPSLAVTTVPYYFGIHNPTNEAAALAGPVNINSLFLSNVAPTISAGFGTSPSIANNNGTASFTINVGTGGTANSGVIGFPTASHGWDVNCKDITTTSSTVFLTKQTASSTTTATIGNFTTSAAAAAWNAGDILSCMAAAY
jgi:hypothetical protein